MNRERGRGFGKETIPGEFENSSVGDVTELTWLTTSGVTSSEPGGFSRNIELRAHGLDELFDW